MRWRQWLNAPVLWLLRSPLHRVVSRSILAIQIRGRVTGRIYTVPVNYIRHGFTLVVLSPRERTWWRNLRSPAPVTLWERGRQFQATAEASTDPDEVARWLLMVLRRSPMYQRSLGVMLDKYGKPRQQAQLDRTASRYAVIRIWLPTFAHKIPTTEVEREAVGGRSQ